MSTLKDKFENYEKQPDEKVWQSIMETMNNRVSTVRRRRIALVTSTAVVASIALLFAVNRNNGDGDVTQTKTVTQQRVERTATVRSDVATIEDVKTVASVDRPLVKDAKTPSIASESQVEAVMPVEYASSFAQGTEVKTLESVKSNNSSATSKETEVSTQESTGLTEVNADVVENNRETVPQRPIEPRKIAFRGGTDGSALSHRGLPCPNLSAGYENAHGRFEYVPIQSMEKNVEILLRLAEIYGEG